MKALRRVEIRGYDGTTPIRSFNDWGAYAMPPERKAKHWKEERSAFELARVWTEKGEPAMPVDLLRLLDSHVATRGTVIRTGITEHETKLPPGTSGPRCHDLALQGEHNGREVTICIEAKADEPFGGTLAEELAKARQRTNRTRFPDRLEWLVATLLGIPASLDEGRTILSPEIVDLPYQLFTAVGGTVVEAQLHKSAMAILVVHEFRTILTTDAKMKMNGKALDDFLLVLFTKNGGARAESFQLRPDQLIGPIVATRPATIEGQSSLLNIPLFIGKLRTIRANP